MIGQHRRVLLLLALLAGLAACDDGQRHAAVGDLHLVSGEVLRNCQVGFRTFGTLNEAGDNAILMPTWLAGTSKELVPWVGAGGVADPARHFVILVDALGNGVSSSPSDGPGSAFPEITIEDMVESQRRLLDTLGVRRLRAVIGTSMGGMQALEWGALHPERVSAVVAIASSPRLPLHDRLRWEELIWDFRLVPTHRQVLQALGSGDVRDALWHLRHDTDDWIAQANATYRYNLPARFGRSLERAAATLPPLLVVVSASDPILDPAPSRELAALAGAELVVLDGRCGHQAPGCEQEAVSAAVRRFLADDAVPAAERIGGAAAASDATPASVRGRSAP